VAARASPPKVSPESTPSYTPVAIVVLIALLAGGLWWWFFLRPGPQPAETNPLTPEMKAYVRNLKLSGVDMKAREDYVKHMLVEITGDITNQGDRALKRVEITCVFYDPYGQVVLRQRLPIVRSSAGGALKPGGQRSFRLPFDNLPESWNQGMPQMVIAYIEFEN